MRGNSLDYLKGNGDFRSGECVGLIGESDIIVTNPPFSLFQEFINLLIDMKKEFLILGNLNAAKQKKLFNEIKNNRIKLGYSQPKYFISENNTLKAFGNIVWFTNCYSSDLKPKLKLRVLFENNKYIKYANYDAIDIPSISKIPDDYQGKMGVPISFLIQYDPKQYKIIGIGNGSYIPEIKSITKEALDNYFNNGGKGHYTTKMRSLYYYDNNGVVKFPFVRIIIQKVT